MIYLIFADLIYHELSDERVTLPNLIEIKTLASISRNFFGEMFLASIPALRDQIKRSATSCHDFRLAIAVSKTKKLKRLIGCLITTT